MLFKVQRLETFAKLVCGTINHSFCLTLNKSATKPTYSTLRIVTCSAISRLHQDTGGRVKLRQLDLRRNRLVAFNCSRPSSTDSMEELDSQVQEITEGKAKVLLPKSVFYNPVQEFNRDLTTCIISQFTEEYQAQQEEENSKGKKKKKNWSSAEAQETQLGGTKTSDEEKNELSENKKGIRIFEGLSASGLRSVRFGLEVPGVKEIIANDFDQKAVEFIEKNIARNGLTGVVKSSYGDASMMMYQNKTFDKRFDVVDIDPYGSASQFLDAAVQAVSDGGMLCITCTDAAVLCGNAGETCYAKYGAMSLRAKFCHEMALRIVLQCVESHANRYSRYIEPLLSLSVDFYIRVFVRLHTGQKQVKMSVTKASVLYNCVGCGSFALQQMASAIPTKGDNHKFVPGSGPPVEPNCKHCGHRHQIGGPIWSAPIHQVDFLDRMLKRIDRDAALFATSERMKGMLSVAREELQDVPLYYVLDDICNILHCTPPNMLQMRSALLNAGFRVSLSHAAKNSYKTDAPADAVWDIMRAWVKLHPVSAKRLTDGSVAQTILKQEPSLEVSFVTHPAANPASRQKGLVRWQHNPEPDWGPKPRARRVDGKESNANGKEGKCNSEKTRDGKESNADNDQRSCDSFANSSEGAKAGVKRPLDQGEGEEEPVKAVKNDKASV